MSKRANWYDTRVPIGTRKREFINWALENKWPFWKAINFANSMFGKKPHYHEPEPLEKEECEHSFAIIGLEQDVRCLDCGETCPDCGGYPGYGELCSTCGTWEG